MGHLSEGELHAWLDGALRSEAPDEAKAAADHLAVCADCRARLEEARGWKEGASALLAALEPQVGGLPPFEEIRAGAEAEEEREASGRGGGPESPYGRSPVGTPVESPVGSPVGTPTGRAGPRFRALAWAASISVAVGAGWAARAQWERPQRVESVAVADRRSEPLQATPRKEAERFDEVATADRKEVGAAARGETSARIPAATEEAAEAVQKGEALRTKPEAAARAAREAAPEAREAAPEAAAPPAPLEAVRGVGAPADAGEEDVWISTDAKTAARWIGGELRFVPGLPVRDVAVSSRDGHRIARIRQVLAPVGWLTIVQVPAAEDEAFAAASEADAAQAAGEGAADARPPEAAIEGEVDGFRLRLSGPVARDSLAALLSRLRGGGGVRSHR